MLGHRINAADLSRPFPSYCLQLKLLGLQWQISLTSTEHQHSAAPSLVLLPHLTVWQILRKGSLSLAVCLLDGCLYILEQLDTTPTYGPHGERVHIVEPIRET